MPLDPAWRDEGTVLQIFLAAQTVRGFARGFTYETFHADELTNNAIILQILIIGEATKRLSQPFREAHPGVPWAQMAGMRDRLVHGYDRWDLEAVWDVVTIDVPRLLNDLEPMVPKPKDDPES